MQALRPKPGDLVQVKLKRSDTALYSGLLIDSLFEVYSILLFDSYRSPSESGKIRRFDLDTNPHITIVLVKNPEKSNSHE